MVPDAAVADDPCTATPPAVEATHGRGGDHGTDSSEHDTQCGDPQPTPPSLASSCPKKGRGQKSSAIGRKLSQQTGTKQRKQTQKKLTGLFTKAYPSPVVPSPLVLLDGSGSLDENKTDSDAVAEAPTQPKLTPLGEGGAEVYFDLPPCKPLTAVEEFRRRLTRHMGMSQPKAQIGGMASILSKDTITKLADTPGEWNTVLSGSLCVSMPT